MMITDRWVLDRRGPKAQLDPLRAYAAAFEEELDAHASLAPTAVIFLTNRECPFRCVMCDLWRNTLDETVPPGAIATQVRAALQTLPPVRQIKLYNAGSFFDPAAIPPEEDDAVATLVAGFDRVIVEAHPGFLAGAYADRCLCFRDRLKAFRVGAEAMSTRAEGPQLEVAIGLETAHAQTLARLNKRMTVESFRRAADFLAANGIDLRVFVLLNPPFLTGELAVEWACRSIDLAAECGATACSVIPTRGGNGAMEALGEPIAPMALADLERVVEYGISGSSAPRRKAPGQIPMRVFADLWDIERLFACTCSPARRERLQQVNRTQTLPPRVSCERCG